MEAAKKIIQTISGKIHNRNYFQFKSTTGAFNPASVLNVLNGQLAGCMFKRQVTANQRKAIAENFWKHKMLKNREDGVYAYNLGAYHYDKELDTYFEEVKLYEKETKRLFEGTDNIVHNFIDTIRMYVKPLGIDVRLASHQGREASPYRMKCWINNGEYALLPHDDLAQCTSKKQNGFEIQKSVNYNILAVNICIENDSSKGGNLHYWNIQPDQQTKKILGVEETGYPYSPEDLVDFEKLVIPIDCGDIYCFNGKNIHAVEAYQKNQQRTIINFFMSFIDSKTIVYWT